MPDHLHALAEGLSDDSDLPAFMKLFKQCSSYEWKSRYGGPLWQRSYFEHVLRDDEDTIAVARYILDNPVRAGLVREPLDYPYLGSMTTPIKDLLYSV